MSDRYPGRHADDRFAEASLARVDVLLPARPYPGLRPFTKQEWPIFFGRERMIDDVIARIVERQVIVLHGDSGCGKSSLVKAGVLARLEQESAHGLLWRTCEMQPAQAPLYTLAESLATMDGAPRDADRVIELRRALNFGVDAPPALARLLRRGERDHVCILIDQFEELFTFAQANRTEARLFVELLVGLSANPQPGLYAVATMRSEFLGVCAQFPGLAEAVNRVQYLLPRMAHQDSVRAIREPARLYGGNVSRDLADRLIADGGGTQDELPLIQHGLMLLHARRASRLEGSTKVWSLDVADYEREIGVLPRLVSTHADEVAASVDPAQTGVVEKLFRALTDINAEGRAIRRPQRFAALIEITGADETTLRTVVGGFRQEGVSFLRPYGNAPLSADDWIDISHEALIRSWDKIADPNDGWLAHEFQDGLVWKSLLERAGSFERDSADVLSATTARERQAWLQRHNPSWAERYGGGWERVTGLLTRSIELAAQSERARRRNQILFISVVTLAAAVCAGFAVYASYQRGESLSRASAALALENRWLDPAEATRNAIDALRSRTPEANAAAQKVRDESNVLAVWRHPGFAPITAAGFSSDGEHVVFSSAWGDAWIWQWRGCESHSFSNYPMLPLRGTAISPDMKLVLSQEATAGGYTIVLRSRDTGEELRRLAPQSAPITAAAFDPSRDRHFIATGSMDSTVKLWDLDAPLPEPVKILANVKQPDDKNVTVNGHTDIVTSVRFAAADAAGHSTDNVVITASQDGRSKVWHWQTGVVETLRAKTWMMFDAAANPRDPRQIVAGNLTGEFFVWTLPARPRSDEFEDFRRLYPHKHQIGQLGFSRDGRDAVTASTDGTAKVFDWNTGRDVRTLTGHHGAVTGADFSPTSDTIVTSSVDGTVRVWGNVEKVADLTQRSPVHSCSGRESPTAAK